MRLLSNLIKSPKIVIKEKIFLDSSVENEHLLPSLDEHEQDAWAQQTDSAMNKVREQRPVSAEKSNFDYSTLMATMQNQRVEILKQASEQSSAIIEDAKRQAQEIIRQAEMDGEAFCERARTQGYSDGFEKGRQDAFEEAQAELSQLGEALRSIGEKKQELAEQYQQELVDLSVEIANKIINAELNKNSELILNIVKDNLKRFRDAKWIKISLSKLNASASALTDHQAAQQFFAPYENIDVELIADAEPDTVIVETEREIVDMSVQTQLANLTSRFKELKRSSRKQAEDEQ
ncbi:MAG TPA: hypothetical protein DCP97_05095 [Ruminococcaceae bacterium]|nr:hypothetical protein [Oscillospiraceae bacterium]